MAEVLMYRAKAYVSSSRDPGAGTIITTSVTTLKEANQLLKDMVASKLVTGGQIETHLKEFGWVVYSD